MDRSLMQLLRRVTPEEDGFLSGQPVDRARYALEKEEVRGPVWANRGGQPPKPDAPDRLKREFIIDSAKMLAQGRLLRVRPHSRFVEFPDHRHSYVEIMYMCSGSTTHVIDDAQTVCLEAGDLLFLNQHAVHRILPAGMDDIGVNFMILPQFFDRAFAMMEGENILREFIVDCLREEGQSSRVLHFRVADLLPVQNLVENMIWTALMEPAGDSGRIQPVTMGLLFLQLVEHADRIEGHSGGSADRGLALTALRYIQDHYRTASLTELSERTGLPLYHLSRVLKKETGSTFKELLRRHRLDRACELLGHSALPVSAIVEAVGYSNTSYFYREFEIRTGLSPGEYRRRASHEIG